jgi:predicted nuclease of predicted toxin-antitoxin system
MNILLDENLPDSLIDALQILGHNVDSINSLKMKGLDNGTLYQEVAQAYDLCFTKDAGFVHNVRQMKVDSSVKLLKVVLQQRPAKQFVDDFIQAFQKSDWHNYKNGDNWP